MKNFIKFDHKWRKSLSLAVLHSQAGSPYITSSVSGLIGLNGNHLDTQWNLISTISLNGWLFLFIFERWTAAWGMLREACLNSSLTLWPFPHRWYCSRPGGGVECHSVVTGQAFVALTCWREPWETQADVAVFLFLVWSTSVVPRHRRRH